MNFLIFISIFFVFIYSSILKDKIWFNSELKPKLTGEDIFMLENTDNSMKIFISTIIKIHRLHFKSKNSNVIDPIFDYKLILDQFIDVLYSINLLILSENNLLNDIIQDFIEDFTFTILNNNRYEYINLSNVNLLDYNEVLKKMCVESFKLSDSNIKFEFLQDQVRVFDNYIIRDRSMLSVMDLSYFKNNQTGYDKIMFWYFEALNLSEVFYFNNYEICVILLDSLKPTKERIGFRLSRTLDQINLIYEPVILKIFNVLKNDDDLCIFSGMNTVEHLELKNEQITKVLISDFELKRLKTLKISKIKISMKNFLQISRSLMLESLHISYINILPQFFTNNFNSNSFYPDINSDKDFSNSDEDFCKLNQKFYNSDKDLLNSDKDFLNSDKDFLNSDKDLLNSDKDFSNSVTRFNNLKDLDIFCCLINEEFINWWKSLKNLEILRIKDIVSNRCLEYNRKITSINKFIPNDHYCFSNDQINAMLSNKNLYHLFTSGLKLRHSSIQNIQHIKSLRYIFLFNCDLESDQVEGFKNLPNLELLNLKDNYKIKKEDINKLKIIIDGRFEILY